MRRKEKEKPRRIYNSVIIACWYFPMVGKKETNRRLCLYFCRFSLLCTL